MESQCSSGSLYEDGEVAATGSTVRSYNSLATNDIVKCDERIATERAGDAGGKLNGEFTRDKFRKKGSIQRMDNSKRGELTVE